MLTVEQKTELSNTLAAISNARKEGKAFTVATLNGRLVIKTAGKLNLLKRAWHHRHQSGQKLLRERIMDALEDMKTQQNFDPVLREQIFKGARSFSFLDAVDIRAIEDQETNIKAAANETEGRPATTAITERRVRQPSANARLFTVAGWDISARDYHPIQASPYLPSHDNGLDFTPICMETLAEEALSEESLSEEALSEASEPCESIIDFMPPDRTWLEEEIPEAIFHEDGFHEDHHSNAIAFRPVIVPPVPTPEPAEPVTLQRPLELVAIEEVESQKADAAEEALTIAHAELLEKIVSGKRVQEKTRGKKHPDDLNITLADARPFLKVYYEWGLNNDVDAEDYHSLYGQLEKHFKATHQQQDFKKLDRLMLWQRINELKATDERAYHYCLNACNSPSSQAEGSHPRITVISRMVSHLLELAHRNPPHIQGHPAEKISYQQIVFLRDVNNIHGLMAQIPLAVTDEDESETTIERTADFAAFQQKLHDDIHQYCTEKESFASLMAALTATNPEEIKEKLRQNKALSPDELSLISRCHHQMLNMETTLGRTWDLGIFTAQSVWPEGMKDQYNTFMKVLDLSELDTPEIQAARQAWLIEKNAAFEQHQKVVVEASDHKGYLLALTQFEAGAEVTLLTSAPKASQAPDSIIRLDPLTVAMLRFHLCDQFEHLFGPPGTSSGIGVIRPDGFADISANALDQALLSQIESLKASGAQGLDFIYGTVDQIIPPHNQQTNYLLNIVSPNSDSYSTTVTEKLLPADLLVLSSQTPAYLQENSAAGLMSRSDEIESLPEKSRSRDYHQKTHWGRCSWIGDSIQNSGLATFQNEPLQSTMLDDLFYAHFQHHLQSRFDRASRQTIGIKKTRFHAIEPDATELKRLAEMTEYQCLKTWCLENPGHIHIEMELPEAFNDYLTACELELTGVGTEPAAIEAALLQIREAWFQAVADQFELQDIDLKPEQIQPESVVTGKRANSESEANLYRQEETGACLIMTTIGDEVVRSRSLDFDDITAAREQILACQQLTTARAARTNEDLDDEDLNEALQNDIDEFDDRYNHARQFLQQTMR